jgi:predicted DNA-binding transcriptional regulator AlpA
MTLARLLGTTTSRLSTEIGPLLDMTTASTGLLCWQDFHPQEWQLASLHQIPACAGNAPGSSLGFYGHRFQIHHVANLRRQWKIPRYEPKAKSSDDELLTVQKAAAALGVAPSTLHRLLNDGIIGGEQLTPGAPWRIRLTDDIKARFSQDPGEGFLPMREAMRALGVTRQTVLQRVKRGELEAIHVMRGKQKGLRIKIIQRQANLFDHSS